MFAPAYLDHNATTPLDPVVREAMLPYLEARFGNASSRHEYGRQARQAIEQARAQVACAVGAHPTEVVFTSGGSEANNLAIKGIAALRRPGLLAVSAIEHPCVREPAVQLRRAGWRISEIAVDGEGRIDAAAWAEALAGRPVLVSVMAANNETGVLQDILALADEARAANALVHTDAVQALGKVEVDFRRLRVHMMTVSAHKIYGPIGAGALIVDKRVELAPLVAGGGQERGLRSGTENVAAIVGFGHACELAVSRLAEDAVRIRALRERLEAGVATRGVTIFSAAAERLPGTSFMAVPGIDGETLVGKLDRAGFAVASGSACSSAQPEPSHTLVAMGVSPDVARGAIRVSLGRRTTAEEVDGFVRTFFRQVDELRNLTAVTA